jgi:hypothetical protein
MSYDLRLFKPIPGEDPLVTARRESLSLPTTAPNPETEALKRKVADALMASDSQLSIFHLDYSEIAKKQHISEEAARIKYRHLELNGPEAGNGIQITLFDNEAAVTIPFWHEGTAAGEVFKKVWIYLETLEREGGYVIYDSQLDRILDRSKDYDAVLSCYAKVINQTVAISPSTEAQKRPWWRFW